MPYLIDADWAIQALSGHRETSATLERLIATQGVAISRRFLRAFLVLNLSDPIMERFAAIRRWLRRRGELIPDFDILLGATALQHDLTVLTSNVRHMRRTPDLKLYRRS